MPFPLEEREVMLSLKGVGPTVVSRLEQIGFESLDQLRGADPDGICMQIAGALRATCWRNSPQARASIRAIVQLADSSS